MIPRRCMCPCDAPLPAGARYRYLPGHRTAKPEHRVDGRRVRVVAPLVACCAVPGRGRRPPCGACQRRLKAGAVPCPAAPAARRPGRV